MGNYGYLSAKPHAVTRVDNTDYLITSTSQQITYSGAGSLVSDAGCGMARIDYDLNNNPVRIQFTNDSVTKYAYDSSGQKLRVTHHTAKPNITRTFGVMPPRADPGSDLECGHHRLPPWRKPRRDERHGGQNPL